MMDNFGGGGDDVDREEWNMGRPEKRAAYIVKSLPERIKSLQQ